MTDIREPRLVIPALSNVYRTLAPITELLIRLAAGLSLLPHGLPKFFNFAGVAQFLDQTGFRPGMMWAVLIALTEVGGGLLLAAGFLTRLACIPILIFLLTAVAHHSHYGFVWNKQGFEYPLFWSIVVFHFLVNGGGRYSVDAALGREI